MGGASRINRQPGLIAQLLRQSGVYGKSFGFFLVTGIALFGGIWLWSNTFLRAEDPALPLDPRLTGENSLVYNLTPVGELVFGATRQSPELFTTEGTYRYRLQVLDRPDQFISELYFVVQLPRAGTEQTVGHRAINNGGAATFSSELLDSQTLLFSAADIGSEAQLAIEFEIPKSFIERSALFSLREQLTAVPPIVWTLISIILPIISALLLLGIAVARVRRVVASKEEVAAPPSRLSPALVGILLNGRLTSRELAATLLDLARRGHLAIHHYTNNDYRFRRLNGNDKLEDFEQVLLEQIFGPAGERANVEEVSFSLAQEVFSKRVSQSFILAYRKINSLGFFYTNPLRLHRRYQLAGALLFVLGVCGFFGTLFLFTAVPSLLFFWIGMILSSLLVTYFSRSLPSRTIYGDRELSKWLAFARYLAAPERANYAAHSQEQYLAYLPYAIIFGVEVEWTQRFYELPFIQPTWYVAGNIATIDRFANTVFPIFGYLSHALALSTQPASR